MARIPISQTLPGTIFDIRSEIRPFAPPSDRGIVIDMMPLTWFNEGEIVDIHSREWQSAFAITKLGVSAAMTAPDDERAKATQRSLLMIMASGNLAGQSYGASMGLIFPQNTGGDKAEAVQGDITWRAKKSGTAGNYIHVNVVKQDESHTITTFFKGQRMYVQRINDIAHLPTLMRENMLIDAVYDETNPDVEFTTGEVNLQGGDNGTIPAYNTRLQAFLDKASTKRWHAIGLAMTPQDNGFSAARVAFRSWLRQLNEDLQEERHGIVAGEFENPDTGMDSDQLDVVFQELEINNDYWLEMDDVVRLFAGRSAGAAANHSQTNDVINQVTGVRPDLNMRQRQDADDRSLFTIIENWDGRYKVLRDVNSFVSFVPEKNIQWRDNRTKRTLHDLMTRWHIIFDTQHKGRTPNNDRGRNLIKGDMDNLITIMESEEKFSGHDVSHISVEPNANSPTAVDMEIIPLNVVNAIDTIFAKIRINWA